MSRRKATASLIFAALGAALNCNTCFLPPPRPSAAHSARAARHGRRVLAAGGGLAAAGLLGVGDAEAFLLKPEEKQVVDIFERASLGTVHIRSEGVIPKQVGEEIRFEPVGKTGTGWVFDEKGHIATNSHVIGEVTGSVKTTVFFADGSEASASVVGVDGGTDIAVLKVDDMPKVVKTACRPLVRGNSGELRVGQDVYAIGYPFNADQASFTRGIISGLGRTVPSSVDGRPIVGVVQHDAGINPGNSGGPLLNSAGEVIGMNTQIMTTTGASVGIGLALPADTVSARVGSILKYGHVRRPTLGVLFGPDAVTKTITSGKGGGIVAGFQKNSPAKAAGMQTSDIIQTIDKQRVKSVNDVYAVQDAHEPGETVSVSVLRGTAKPGQEKLTFSPVSFSVTLVEAESGANVPNAPPNGQINPEI